jgi:hypothetical protein
LSNAQSVYPKTTLAVNAMGLSAPWRSCLDPNAPPLPHQAATVGPLLPWTEALHFREVRKLLPEAGKLPRGNISAGADPIFLFAKLRCDGMNPRIDPS